MLKREERALRQVLADLEQAQSYLLSERVLVCIRQSYATTTLHFTNKQGEICYSVNKEIGSDLARLHHAIGNLRRFLEKGEGKQ